MQLKNLYFYDGSIISNSLLISILSVDLLLDTAEIQETLGRSYGVGDEIDESDLDAELAGLEDELDGEELSADAQPVYLRPSSLPVQPTATPKSAVGEPAVANAEDSKVDEYGLPTHA